MIVMAKYFGSTSTNFGGKPKRISGNVDRLVVSERREHSRKPDIIRKHITDLVGDLPRIELFARQSFEGWDHWGNEL